MGFFVFSHKKLTLTSFIPSLSLALLHFLVKCPFFSQLWHTPLKMQSLAKCAPPTLHWLPWLAFNIDVQWLGAYCR